MIKLTSLCRASLRGSSDHVLAFGVILPQVIRGSVTSPFTWLSLYLLVLHYCYIKRVPLKCGCARCRAWDDFPRFKWESLLS